MYKNFPHLDQFIGGAQLNPVNEKLNQYLVQRSNQICLSFSYFGWYFVCRWNPYSRMASLGIPQPRPKSDGQSSPSIYEMRSYWLKPGTLIEWGNLWHKGVQHRPDAKVLGVFSQIGELYNVHHMWSYKDFQHRKQMRTNAWAKPGWSEKYVCQWLRTNPSILSVAILAWNIQCHWSVKWNRRFSFRWRIHRCNKKTSHFGWRLSWF